jgi:hypothetical protein
LSLLVQKHKNVYEALNKMQAKGNILNGYIWSNFAKLELETMIRSNGNDSQTNISS